MLINHYQTLQQDQKVGFINYLADSLFNTTIKVGYLQNKKEKVRVNSMQIVEKLVQAIFEMIASAAD